MYSYNSKLNENLVKIKVIGIGGGMLQFAVGKNFTFSLGGVALATLVGIFLNLIIHVKASKEEKSEK